MNKINVAIIGGAGYTGGEITRILLQHPYVNIAYIHSRSNANNSISSVHKDLYGDTELSFTENIHMNIDVMFLCLGHGESQIFLAENPIASHVKIIDLSQDFRLKDYTHSFIYGLPELNKSLIKEAQYIANPGCFATAIQLGLLPLIQNNLIENQTIHITGITGSTGAGQKLQSTTQHSWRANNMSAYKTLQHQHIREIEGQYNLDNTPFNFVPWRGDFTRGIFVSSQLLINMPLSDIKSLYKEHYHDHPFSHVADFDIDMKMVVNTNKCLIQIEQKDDTIVIHSCIDNLIKGASGQAVQNMNIIMGWPEDTGLRLKSIAF